MIEGRKRKERRAKRSECFVMRHAERSNYGSSTLGTLVYFK